MNKVDKIRQRDHKFVRKTGFSLASIVIFMLVVGCASFVIINNRFNAENKRIAQVHKKEIRRYNNLKSKKMVTKKEFVQAFNLANKHNNKKLLNDINGLEIYDAKTKHHYITHTEYQYSNSNYDLKPID